MIEFIEHTTKKTRPAEIVNGVALVYYDDPGASENEPSTVGISLEQELQMLKQTLQKSGWILPGEKAPMTG